MMASWYYKTPGDSLERVNSNAESDILAPDEYQEVLNEADKSLIDCVYHEGLFQQPYDNQEMPETKMYCPPALPSADSTFQMGPNMTSTGPLPAREDYGGPFSFSVLLDGVESTKNKWTYSTMLNKLYIVWDKIIPIQFKWTPLEPNFVVRALPVYTDAQDMKSAVRRCLIHVNPADTSNDGFEHVRHVIRSDNPGARYEENPVSERCSVVVPLGELQPGTGTVTVTYKFMCKTTCVTGMGRRPITVLFTLERLNGDVVGRQKLNVKICSCPKRDMQKDEKTANEKEEEGCRKRPLAVATKRMKTEEDDEPYHIDMAFDDAEVYKNVLESMQGVFLRFLRTGSKSSSRYRETEKLLKDVEVKLAQIDA